MNIEPIKIPRDYRRVFKKIENLMMAKHNTPEGDRVDVLVTLVDAWLRAPGDRDQLFRLIATRRSD